jgi:hypothetical protein
MSIRTASVMTFQPPGTERRGVSDTAPEPGRNGPDALPDREWGLSAGQVVAVVAAIVAACELFAVVF